MQAVCQATSSAGEAVIAQQLQAAILYATTKYQENYVLGFSGHLLLTPQGNNPQEPEVGQYSNHEKQPIHHQNHRFRIEQVYLDSAQSLHPRRPKG